MNEELILADWISLFPGNVFSDRIFSGQSLMHSECDTEYLFLRYVINFSFVVGQQASFLMPCPTVIEGKC